MHFFKTEIDANGIALVTFDRPPVNAVSGEVYVQLRDLAIGLSANDKVRVVILTSPPNARAWCAGADLKDFLPLTYESRMARYAMINECMPHFYNLERPVIAALNSHVLGAGLVFASFCDIRVAAEDAYFQHPEIERGAIAGGGSFYLRLNMPQAVIREMIFTARRFSADEMLRAGFLNHVVPKADVTKKAMELARVIATKSLPALKANKIACNAVEGLGWQEGYRLTNTASAELTVGKDAKENVRAFFEKRDPKLVDE